ncbi:MAG: competence/damage-inducible protein A [Leptolyngbyaceae cyanobacterium RM1_1_2]|nr:competence/damage-inducible protein A [Leptolyngbyaceae cyanobacterium RM1_1_2]
MKGSAEIICVGTELLLGEILNSNAQYLAQQLAQLGIPHYYQTVVGDNVTRLQQAVAIACGRSHLLIFTGGLGPTPDDLTTETLAGFFKAPLSQRPEILQDIRQKFSQRGRVMSDNNRKQALLPEGAAVLPNPVGSAPGMIWQPRAELLLMTFPGVPSEMKAMWHTTAVGYLKHQGWIGSAIYSRTLRFWGISESALAEKVAPFFEQENPTVAPYASRGEVRLRISAKTDSEVAAEQMIQPVEAAIRAIAGADCFGADEDTLASVVGQLLRLRSQTLAVAESCTGGGLGQALTVIPGSSDYFLGGIIAYDNAVKKKILQVEAEALDTQGAVSDIVAQQMAVGVKSQLSTDWGISITGIAGPGGGSSDKPVGLVYIGLAAADGSIRSYEYRFSHERGRDWVRHVSVCTALDLLRRRFL